ncbi:MAG: hypothetical protein V3V03_06145 [Hyphomonadaceae bacterium]
MAKFNRFVLATALGITMTFTVSAQDANITPKPVEYASVTTQATTTVGSPVSREDTISRAAAVYATYQSSVTELRQHPFSSASDIDAALTNLGGQNPGKLTNGWLAYSALVASQSTEYQASVRDIDSFYGRETLLTGLRNNYHYARTLDGGDAAVSSALSAINADSRRLTSTAAAVKEQAYSLQGVSWAKARVSNSGAKADSIRATAVSGPVPRSSLLAAMASTTTNAAFAQAGGSGAPSLWDGVTSAASTIRFPTLSSRGFSSRTLRVRSGKERIADRIATLAAYRIIGEDRSAVGAIQSTMSDRQVTSCINMAQLNLQQCVAAAHNQFEIPFCIGEHALADVGQCFGNMSN